MSFNLLRLRNWSFLKVVLKYKTCVVEGSNSSQAGRLTLAKSVVQALPVHRANFLSLLFYLSWYWPLMQRFFIWGDTPNHHKLMHWLPGILFVLQSLMKGLVLQEIWMSMMMKAGLNLCHHNATYKCDQDVFPRIHTKNLKSNFWRGVRKGWENVNANLIW